MTVSVAIASYNRSVMVCQAVEAALAQSRPPLEVVVSDDASTDGTHAALECLAAGDPRVRVFSQAVNSGGVPNWNYAIRQTRGDYIAWCSDDDRHLIEHLAVSSGYLDRHPEIGLVHSGFVDEIEMEGVSRREARPFRFPAARILKRSGLIAYMTRYYDWPFHPSTLVMRRAVWEQVGEFDPAYALADTDWFVRAVEQFPAAMLAAHGVANRRHAGNWSNRLGSARMQREILEIVARSIRRVYAQEPLQRIWWSLAWRANVQLRLALTLRMRVASGHTDAACAAWDALMDGSGGRVPGSLRRAGSALIRCMCGAVVDPTQSVTPL